MINSLLEIFFYSNELLTMWGSNRIIILKFYSYISVNIITLAKS